MTLFDLLRWRGCVFKRGLVEVRERDGVRTLHLDSDTIQSAMRLDRPNDLELAYTRAMAAFLLFHPAPERILMIGLGGGALPKFLYHRLPEASLRVVELNADVVEVARSHFGLPADSARLVVELGDGADCIARASDTVDVILIDAYDGRSIAEQAASAEFYAQARCRLGAGGIMVANLWSNDRRFESRVRQIERAFDGRCLCLPAERPGNIVVFAFADAPFRIAFDELTQRAAALELRHGLEFRRFVAGLRTMNRHDAGYLLMGETGEK